MKITVIGAGNVGALAAMRIAQEGLGDVALVDIAGGVAKGKALDMEDARYFFGVDYHIQAGDDISLVSGSDIVVMTAGLARKPGMTREDLLAKNAQIVRQTCLKIKELAQDCILIIVTNPLDIMSYLALKVSGLARGRVIGMGVSLDASRFANIIAQDMNLSIEEIEPVVIASHGEGMMPSIRLTKVKGVSLEKAVGQGKAQELAQRTIKRGAEIVGHLGTGSAFFAPSAAIADLVKAICRDEKKVCGVCAYLAGEYGLNDVSIGAPCRIGKNGIEEVIELNLNNEEKQAFVNAASSLQAQYKNVL